MSVASAPSAELIRSAAAGNREAYGNLVRAHQNLVSSIALSVVRDVTASEDVTQEVFLQAWRGLERLRSPESFLPWLRQLTRNRATQFLRKRRGVTPLESELLVDASADHATALLRREEEQRLADAIAELPDASREVITLYYREGESVAQVARLLELREDAVKKRLSRAREQLRAAVLDDAAQLLKKTAPGEKLCAAIVAALPSAGPSSGLLAALLGKLGFASGAFAGVGMGVSGILVGHHLESRKATSERERKDLRRLRNLALVLMAVTLALNLVAFPSAVLIWWTWAFFIAGMFALYGVWFPRILAERRRAELAADPTRHARWMLKTWFPRIWIPLCGAGTLAWIWYVTGRGAW